MNIGISKSGDFDWFTGRGFATLNRGKLKEPAYAANLSPQVKLEVFPGTNLHLVWSQVKHICTDCHTDEHVRFDCPKRGRRLCHRCQSPNHLVAECPTAPWKTTNAVPNESNNESKSSKPTPGPKKNEFFILLNILLIITGEQAICMFFCEEYNEDNIKKLTKEVDDIINVEICYTEDPTKPIISRKRTINQNPFLYHKYQPKKSVANDIAIEKQKLQLISK